LCLVYSNPAKNERWIAENPALREYETAAWVEQP
jgi:hypothetical protein